MLEYTFKGEFHFFFNQNFCMIQFFRCKRSLSEWFDVKQFIAEKLTGSDFCTVVVTGTRGHKYNKSIYYPEPPVNLRAFSAFTCHGDDKMVKSLKNEVYLWTILPHNTPACNSLLKNFSKLS